MTSEIDTDSLSLSSLEASESALETMAQLKAQVQGFKDAAALIQSQVKRLYSRAKAESIDWTTTPMKLKPELAAWAKSKRLPTTLTLEQFLDACMSSATSVSLENRTLTFEEKDASLLLDADTRSITIFQLIAKLPSYFV